MCEAVKSVFRLQSTEHIVEPRGSSYSDSQGLSIEPMKLHSDQKADKLGGNALSLSAMEQSFQTKTKYQSSDMKECTQTLELKVVIGTKKCNLGCRICFSVGLAVGRMAANGRPLNF